jgi:hypothetical protein
MSLSWELSSCSPTPGRFASLRGPASRSQKVTEPFNGFSSAVSDDTIHGIFEYMAHFSMGGHFCGTKDDDCRPLGIPKRQKVDQLQNVDESTPDDPPKYR